MNFLKFLLLSLLFIGCSTTKNVVQKQKDDGSITLKFVQVNDVYEIAPLSGGKYGGMSRVAYVRDSIKAENPNTYLFMAGDFLNPSLLGTVKLNGERIHGKQMIEVMNAMDFTLVTFGNHEFDIDEADLQKRLDESTFQWMSSNTFQKKDSVAQSFVSGRGNVAFNYTLNAVDEDGTNISIGFVGSTIPSNPKDYVFYGDIYDYSQKAYTVIKDSVDITVGLTHLEIEQDVALANKIPELKLVMGGHEHNNMLVPTNNGVVAKADANAKTVYVHTLVYNTITKQLNVDSQLVPIDDTTPSNPQVKAIVDKWNVILEEKIKEVIADPYEVIYRATIPLDGTDSASRGVQTNLGEIITHAMALSFNSKVDAAIVNGGSIRIDDQLSGDVTSMDIFRVLPFGGHVLKVKISGALLKEVLDYGKSKGGTGAYLQRYNITENETYGWNVGPMEIDTEKVYTIAMSDFLLKGFDIPFLTKDNVGILEVYEPSENEAAADVRKAVIEYLKSIN
ncbi:bifunctional metallophosphatase/5'-nucleotidase [Patiriisocius hiemis]|uniref:Bifunctional metallophosphatase/5'-nucleotidase n=1 Tax=Patiriisocius hiemis TaxID=3075604 RepID=A0ABU2Y943_9FLAO|nr:bifunctional metallophosphatase/5'-nucleotidase [Constantimarinum sp. W242]MDT0554693.1 bifunctional metallophosphatase/5'-nucleotidase [Constantimarinum sp. W242]